MPDSSTQAQGDILSYTALAFDFGTHRIGLAVGQSILGSARPLPALKARDGVPDWNKIKGVLHEWKPDILIIGHPLNMDDTDNHVTLLARKFSRKLNGRFHLPCYLWDERLSTRDAKERMTENKSTADLDSIAAQIILESFFRSNPKIPTKQVSTN